MSSSVILKATGLQTSPNELDRPDGALIEASNVIIKRDGIIEQRRGFSLYGSQLPDVTETVKQLTTYRNRILRHYADSLEYDSNGSGNFQPFFGSFTETEAGLRMKFIESNGNLYFTTDKGIKKVSARTADDFSGAADSVISAGAVKAVDLTGKVIYTPNSQAAWFPQDSAVAYRVVWAYTDLNNNLIQGAPSQRLVVSNPMIGLLIRDYTRLLAALDNFQVSSSSSRISDRDYVQVLGLILNATASELYTNLLALTKKLDEDILYANQTGTDGTDTVPLVIASASIDSGIATIKFSSGDPKTYFSAGSKIYLDGFNLTIQQEIQTVTFNITPTGGTFKLKYKTNESAAINWNDAAPAIQTKLRAVSGLENVIVSGAINNTTGLTLTFPASDGDMDQVIEGTGNTLTPATTITRATTQKGIKEKSGDINKAQTIVSAENAIVPDLAYITFNTTAIGAVNPSSATIVSNEYRAITQPISPDIPATNDQLVDLQVYLENIITRLSSEPDSVISSSQKITFSSTPTSGTFKLKYGTLTSADINWDDDATEIKNKLNVLTDLANIDVTGAINSTTGLTLSNIDGLKYTFIVDSNTLSPSTNISVSTSDLLSLDEIAITTTSTVELNITIPQGINPNYFFQVYRTSVAQATGVARFDDLVPSEEYQLVYEAYPELPASSITIEDVTDDAFRGANLYTNASTGEGILQSNEIPPLAKDINRYRNSIFYANTRTRHQLLFSLLGVTNMINKFDLDGTVPKITISNGTSSNTYQFVLGQQQITTIETVADISKSLQNKYFLISSTLKDYYVWFDVNNEGTDPNPVLTPSRTGIKVSLNTNDSDVNVAQKIKNVLSTYLDDFIPTISSNIVTVTNYSFGSVPLASLGTATSFTIQTEAVGQSEDETSLSVLLSTSVSPSRAVAETTQSLVRIINKNPNESVYAYYVSSAYDVPGKIFLQARELEQIKPFYIVANNDVTGTSFNPDASPSKQIDDITIENPTTVAITISSGHGLLVGDQVMITNTNCTPAIDGLRTVTYVSDAYEFYIAAAVTSVIPSPNATGALIKASSGVYSENEERANRVYYSKYQQPEAVPSVNYFDVGAQDKAILRILPLRTSLFVFKEDGLYRISGESAPFQLELFDISFITLAPDSVSVCNNVIYAWTTQGIQSLTEGGASIISRSIDNIILRTQSSNFINFKTATWGIGYESDNSYLVYTVKNEDDENATIAYRFSTLTNTWTTYNLSHVAGVVNYTNDKLYLAPSDVAYIEQERKTFSRLDYADREIDSVISENKVLNNTIVLPTITGIEIGDVFTQDQSITVFNFNMLLDKLDIDVGVGFKGIGDENYSTLSMSQGDDPRGKLIDLATKLDSDPVIVFSSFVSNIQTRIGTVSNATAANSTVITSAFHGLKTGRVIAINGSNTTPSIDGEYEVTVINNNTFSIPTKVAVSGTAGNWQTVDGSFQDLKTCYNFIISALNSDTSVSYSNYTPITNSTLMEAIVTKIDVVTRRLTLNLTLDFIIGDVKIYKAIESSFAYSPITFGDPLLLKHLREATMMFETRTLTNGVLSFKTDLLPELVDVPFKLDGNGIFGHVSNFGDGFFGGLSNSAPFRTYIPRQCQRCRYMIVRFSHKIAREDYRVNGCTLTGEIGQSSRAYR